MVLIRFTGHLYFLVKFLLFYLKKIPTGNYDVQRRRPQSHVPHPPIIFITLISWHNSLQIGNYTFLFPRLPISRSISLEDGGIGDGVDRPTDSGISRLTLMEGPAIPRLMSNSFSL